ncbi:MAG: transcriptional regulator [Methanosarcinaceae archaeon]|nr:transcriptional regulator [Methanosarcinaceae archaeon]
MNELIGFVTGNSNRQKLLELLGSKNNLNGARIAKTLHIARPVTDKILEEMIEKELVAKEGELYQLTELGTTVERRIHNI